MTKQHREKQGFHNTIFSRTGPVTHKTWNISSYCIIVKGMEGDGKMKQINIGDTAIKEPKLMLCENILNL